MKPITIEDVARLSGVSRGTVSRVINGSQNVNKETRKRVLEEVFSGQTPLFTFL